MTRRSNTQILTVADDLVREERPPSETPEVVSRLVAGHREFLAFLKKRAPSEAIAEDILQAAFVRALDRGAHIRDAESAVAWFYRLLRNALTDHYRQSGRERQALDRHAVDPSAAHDEEIYRAVCRCMNTLVPNLKAEYAEILRRVDFDEAAIPDVARDLGLSLNNTNVRLHRARQALKRELERSCGTCATHGCLDCTCDTRSACGGGTSKGKQG